MGFELIKMTLLSTMSGKYPVKHIIAVSEDKQSLKDHCVNELKGTFTRPKNDYYHKGYPYYKVRASKIKVIK